MFVGGKITTIKDLIPWNKGRSMPAQGNEDLHPFLAMHREMNRMFDDVFRGFDLAPLSMDHRFGAAGWPIIDIDDTGKEIRITAELPGLEEKDVSNERTGLIMGSGGPSTRAIVQAADNTREKGPKKVGPFEVPKAMSSTNSATLSTPYHIKGVSYSISSACSTSAHCIGNGAELIQLGKQDIVFAGGGEELDWTLSVLFDAMNAMSSDFNDRPEVASRAYDAKRDGFVIAGGAGVVVLEELDHARARGARLYGELVGYGATSDGYDMVQPSGEGAARCMRMAMQNIDGEIGYINPHATSTPIGDLREIVRTAWNWHSRNAKPG